ncbi:MAG: HEAT repeat domain-containing protein [Akkermansiaceae bacterium]|nr:HEAT repeat domain-containing protein [Akkermansiaceae bacterium]
MKLFPMYPALLAGLMTTGAIIAADAPPAASQEAKLIAVLQSDAPPQDKAITCKRLALCGTKAAVPALAALLSDEQLASWARIGLEAIPDPAVDAALREAAGKLQGRLQLGVINSLGARHDEKAVAWLSQQLAVANPPLQAAPAAALGRIGGEQASQALGQALTSATATTLPAFCEAGLRNADHLIAQGKHDQAAAICERVLAMKTPRHIRMEAMRSLIVARQAAGIPLLIAQLKSDDDGMVAVAMGLAHDLPGADLTKALTAAVTTLPPAKQVYVIEALGARRDRSVGPTLLALTKAGSAEVCIAAVGALTKLGDVAALPRLVEIAVAPDSESAKAAQSAMVAFPAAEADAACLAMLVSKDPGARMTAADLISRRATYSAVPAVAKAAREDADPAVRTGCLATLRELGGLPELAAVVEILVKNPSAGEAQAAENALATICGRQTDKGACAEKLIAGLAAAQPAPKCALLRVLHAVADAGSLQAVRAAMTDPDKDVQDTATRLLCNWSTVAAAPDLLVLARTSANPTFKVLALRGYLRVGGGKDVSGEQRLAMCKEAAAMVQRDEERMILLGVLGNAGDAESLAMAATQLDNPALKAEACLASVAIAERLVKSNPAAVVAVMGQVLKAGPDEKLTERANAVLKEAK